MFLLLIYFQLSRKKKDSRFDLIVLDPRLFQLHLERIADYLSFGEGAWWHHNKRTNEIIFHDGDSSPNEVEGFKMMSFCNTTLYQSQEYVRSTSLLISRAYEKYNQGFSFFF